MFKRLLETVSKICSLLLKKIYLVGIEPTVRYKRFKTNTSRWNIWKVRHLAINITGLQWLSQ